MKVGENRSAGRFRGFASSFRKSVELASGIAVVVAVVLFATGSLPNTAAKPRERQIPIPAQPVPIADAVMWGAPNARWAILQFSDFECPYCGTFATNVLPVLKARYIDDGRLKFAFRYMPLSSHRNAAAAASAAACAADQGRFPAFHDLLFENQRALDDASLTRHAAASGIDMRRYDACRAQEPGHARVVFDMAQAKALGVTGTPAFFVGKLDSNGNLAVTKTIKGTKPVDTFMALVAEALGEK